MVFNKHMSNAAATAYQLGRQAFAAGLRVPMQDEALAGLLTAEVSKHNVKLMKAWSQGWTAANLATPIED